MTPQQNTASPAQRGEEVAPQATALAPLALVPMEPWKRRGLSLCIIAFCLFHLGLSARGAVLQDDRFAWRMFHNIGFSNVRYEWVKENGKVVPYRPKKDTLVSRSHLYLLAGRKNDWRPTYYSEGTTRNMVDNYARYMGEEKRPEWAVAFRATLKVRINDETEVSEYVYEYPKGAQ